MALRRYDDAVASLTAALSRDRPTPELLYQPGRGPVSQRPEPGGRRGTATGPGHRSATCPQPAVARRDSGGPAGRGRGAAVGRSRAARHISPTLASWRPTVKIGPRLHVAATSVKMISKYRVTIQSKEFFMPRPVTMFTGQWADLPLEELAKKFKSFGYDGLELACWGDHFQVDLAMAEPEYCERKRELLERNGLQVWAISNHLVGQAVLDVIDSRHKAILPPHGLGRRQSGRRQRPGGRGDEERGPSGAEAGRDRGQRFHRFEHLAVDLFLPARLAADDRRRLQAAGRALEPDPRRLRRMRREVRPGSPSHGDRLRPLHGRAGPGSPGTSRGVRLQLRPQPFDLAGRRSGGVHSRLPGPHLSTST